MATLTFDTLQFVQRLKKAGIVEAETEAIAEAVRDIQASADLATKADLIRWVVGVGILQTALIAAMLLQLIPN